MKGVERQREGGGGGREGPNREGKERQTDRQTDRQTETCLTFSAGFIDMTSFFSSSPILLYPLSASVSTSANCSSCVKGQSSQWQ